jgi:ATP-dependent DNA helicase RecG
MPVETTSENPLLKPVEELSEVGPVRAKALRSLGVSTLGDLLEYFPRDYQYESEEKPIPLLRENEIGIARGEVAAVNYIPGPSRSRFEATLADEQHRLSLVFFNGGYLRRQLHPGIVVRVRGMVKYFRGIAQMVNPKWEVVEPTDEKIADAKLRAIYPATAKLPSERLGEIIAANLESAVSAVHDWVDADFLKNRKLMGRADAYRAIHQPVDRKQAIGARRRLIYDELLLMQLALAIGGRQNSSKITAPIMRIDKNVDQRIRGRFPFSLTDGQRQAIWEIVTDLKSGKPMKRLLQGDVGSGKTVVAVYAMLVAVTNKMQAALLAPTEILAEQHFFTLKNLLRDSKVTVELFTSRTRRQSKGIIDGRLAEGEINLAVGTQALLQEKIEFANLGLVVVDEQHRLGVKQRAVLTDKAQSPHYLVMTATPIPRTLALSYFADFDLTSIQELPPGRQPISTRWVRPSKADEAYNFIRSQIGEGRQAYVVLPQIDDGGLDGPDDDRSVLKQLDVLGKGPLKGLRLAPLHGQMPPEEKEKTMNAFREGEIDVLISTTVIEVGIDVPNATVILIDAADRFGLSQLHQLRGRVGRGEHLSYCFLISDAPTAGAEARLSALVSSTSGFEIAEMDLKLRGPGEFFGTRQHGLPEFKLADVTSETDLLRQAREDALELLRRDPKLLSSNHLELKSDLLGQFGKTLGLVQIG